MKKFIPQFFILFCAAFLLSCETESSDDVDFTTKNLTQIYESEGVYYSNKEGSFTVLLPSLPAGSNYKFYTDQIYNLSYNDDEFNDNKIAIFMEIEGSEDRDLSREEGVVQPPVEFNLNNIINIPESTPLDTNSDITLLLVHDDQLNIDWVVDSYFHNNVRRKWPNKLGSGLIRKL